MKINTTCNCSCSEFEPPSAVLDGVETASTHVEACPACADRLHSYKKIDECVGRLLSLPPPSGLAERIIAAAAAERRRLQTISFARNWIMRAAAGLALAGGVGIVILGVRDSRAAKPPVPDTAVADRPPPAQFGIHNAPASFTPDGNNLNMNDFMPVASDTGVVDFGQSGSIGGHPPAISSEVRQVWVVENLKSAAETAAAAAATAGISGVSIKATGNTPGALLAFKTDKKRLAEFVRILAAKGFKLMTPTEPQPETAAFSSQADELVVYVAELVPK